MNVTTKLTDILGLRKQPENATTVPNENTGMVSATSQRVKSIASKNKTAVLATAAVVLIAGALFGLRQVSTGLRGLRVTPADPNLYKTVKTTVGKSSMVSSMEAEINNNSLSGKGPSTEVSMIAQKWKYQPLGSIPAKKLLDTGKVKATIPLALSSVAAPPAPPVDTPRERIVVRTVYPKSQRKQKQAEVYDPFNTVRIGESAPVTEVAARPAAVPPAATAATKEADGVRFIPAVVYGKQSIRTASKVRFRTTETVTFQGVYIPRNTILTAIAYLGSGRIQFQVPARIVAGQKLPVDLMCVDKDYQTGITYNYDYVDDNMRQVGGSTVNDAVNGAASYLPYGSALGVAGSIGSSAVRGITNAVTSGKRQRTMQQVEIQDGYQVFFKSTKS